MGNKNAIPPEVYQWKKGQSGNPSGQKKGTVHLSTQIQNMLNDPTFSFKDRGGNIIYEGAPVNAIIAVAIFKSMLGEKDAREWLAKHGYGLKVNLNSEDPVEEVLRRLGLINKENEGNGAGQTEGVTDTAPGRVS